MPFVLRVAAIWLAGCALAVGLEFSGRIYVLLPYFYDVSDFVHAALLFVVAGAVGCVAWTALARRRAIVIGTLVGGHLIAIASTYAFLTSRIHCFNIQEKVEYRLPDDGGAFILLGPTLFLVL